LESKLFVEELMKASADLLIPLNVAIYDVEYQPTQKYLCLFIINPLTRSATIDECVAVDRALDPLFEHSPWIPEGLTVEVSSPGIFRPIKNEHQAQWALEQRVRLDFLPEKAFIDSNKKRQMTIWGNLKSAVLEQEKLYLTLELEAVKKLKKGQASKKSAEEPTLVEIAFDHLRKCSVEPLV
jgi:ribosome maturation factor RimP